MLKNIINDSLVIAPQTIKKQILREMGKQNKLLNIKFMTLHEFKNNYFGTHKKEAIYYLMKNYNLNYEVSLEYLTNIFYNYKPLNKYYDELKKNNLLITNDNFKNCLDKITIIGYEFIDDYVKKELEKYKTNYIELTEKKYIPNVYEFNRQEDEITFIAIDIIKKLKQVDINNIYLVNVTNDYKQDIKRIFRQFNININLDDYTKIYGTVTANQFIKNLKEMRNIKKALDSTPQNIIYNKIVDILNEYTFIEEVDDFFIEIIIHEFKNAALKKEIYKNAINCVNLNEMTEGNYYYILGFNQGIIPKIFQDDELIKDREKSKLGILTSIEKFKLQKEATIKLIGSINNIIITYKLKDNYQTYYPSPLINELKLNVLKNPVIPLSYSHKYNKYVLASNLDNYLKYNEISPNLKDLLKTYFEIPYLTYNNNYKKINKEKLLEKTNNKLNLSYTNINSYCLCAFKFYIDYILKLGVYEETFSTKIGTLFHNCLSKMYEPDFDLEKDYYQNLEQISLTYKEKFFVNKLFDELKYIKDIIKKQEEHSKFENVVTEKKITITKKEKTEINIVGIIDKIKYLEKNDNTYLYIVDYKTGSVKATLDNINYGLNMQLPMYIYLLKNSMNNSKICGFYLQPLVHNNTLNETISDKYKKLRLDGFTINKTDIIELIDDTYEKSDIIKGMSTSTSGFSKYAKLVSEEDIDKIGNMVENKINELTSKILDGFFDINPKRINDDLIGCQYCKYHDLCFRKEENIVDLKNTKFEEIVGDNNA